MKWAQSPKIMTQIPNLLVRCCVSLNIFCKYQLISVMLSLCFFSCSMPMTGQSADVKTKFSRSCSVWLQVRLQRCNVCHFKYRAVAEELHTGPQGETIIGPLHTTCHGHSRAPTTKTGGPGPRDKCPAYPPSSLRAPLDILSRMIECTLKWT